MFYHCIPCKALLTYANLYENCLSHIVHFDGAVNDDDGDEMKRI